MVSHRKKISWQSLSYDTALTAFGVASDTGLPEQEYARRKEKYGENILRTRHEAFSVRFFWELMKNPLVLMLFSTGIFTFIFGEYLLTIVILIACTAHAGIIFFQKWRTRKVFAKLKEIRKSFSCVVRNGRTMDIPTENLVPGDIILLATGYRVGADARLIFARELEMNESLISDERVGVKKNATKTVPRERPIDEQVNMVWAGTLVSAGVGKAVVVATGGRVQCAALLERLHMMDTTRTPLQKNVLVAVLSLAAVVILCLATILAFGASTGSSFATVILLSLAVLAASVHTRASAAVTLAHAMGMETLAKKGGFVRNLAGVETLGAVTVLLTGKTGILTEGKIRISEVTTPRCVFEQKTNKKTQEGFSLRNNDERTVLLHAVLASDARIEWNLHGSAIPHAEEWHGMERISSGETGDRERSLVIHGRPFERGVLLAGLEGGIRHEDAVRVHPRTDFLPFDSSRQCAVSVHKKMGDAAHRLVLVGAPEFLLSRAVFFLEEGVKKSMTAEMRSSLASYCATVGKRGERSVAVAYKDTNEKAIPLALKKNPEEYEDARLVFAGFLVCSDTIRASARQAVSFAQEAGIRVILVTGDNRFAAEYAAEALGIRQRNQDVAEGEAVRGKSDDALGAMLSETTVFARMLPKDKERLVLLLRARGEVVAMTGDDTCDARALQSAHVGITRSNSSEAVKESSGLFLMRGGVDTFLHAVKTGRSSTDSVRKTMMYVLSASLSEVFLLGAAVALGGPFPFLPAQVFLISVMRGSFVNFVYAFGPEAPDVLERDPVSAVRHVFGKSQRLFALVLTLVTTAVLVGLYAILLRVGTPEGALRTFMFLALAFNTIFLGMLLANPRQPFWRINFASNTYLLGTAVLCVMALSALYLFSPFTVLFSLEPLGKGLFLLLAGFCVVGVSAVEIAKRIAFRWGD
ncbi:MAG: hypothetical protein A3D67_03850 [Candidatus Lloydbacteria bacterium RIFCSPHIGHO2_02_FULL_51_22]|uniref:Cation-transporting P-type ATPase N-terminal domain-containing protein n=2 Tax=Candidatus Lloydiibacteriota TaxID=1817910 RepID=A0A1G2D9G0_9BACT|nr:MAG: hypothetical protein A3D67_03850 [Candidatus Lloydbacteria bacterium RIFCSPHIGHO2_02_FULL_51_22]OGZ15285.1 MAG: hypothetical protein A3J08_00690 [Candidatus Lloydbacteria bacterium RIFCSPLOWO2_02_FULL_51_11]